MGVVTMIESFPARSEACQNVAGPLGPPGNTGSSEKREFGAGWRGRLAQEAVWQESQFI